MKNNKMNLLSLAVLAAGMFAATASMAAAESFKVGMEITYPPFESYDKDKNVVGSDPELATALAKIVHHLKARFVGQKDGEALVISMSAKTRCVMGGTVEGVVDQA